MDRIRRLLFTRRVRSAHVEVRIALAVLLLVPLLTSPAQAQEVPPTIPLSQPVPPPCETFADNAYETSPLTRDIPVDPDGNGPIPPWAVKEEPDDGRVVFTLLRDLRCSHDLLILDPLITLNLNGHSVHFSRVIEAPVVGMIIIAGPGSLELGRRPGAVREEGPGIAANVKITSECESPAPGDPCLGKVLGFSAGVFIDQSSGNEISNLLISRGGPRPPTGTFPDTVNKPALMNDVGDGVVIRNGSANSIRNNLLVGNGPRSGVRIVGLPTLESSAQDTFTPTSLGNRIEDNIILDSPVGHGAPLDVNTDKANRAGAGIYLPPNAAATIVEGNVVAGSGPDGISVSERYDYVTYNTLINGVQSGGQANRLLPSTSPVNLIKGNAVLNNGFGGTNPKGAAVALISVTPRKGDGIRLMTEGNFDQDDYPSGTRFPRATNALDPNDQPGEPDTQPTGRRCDHLAGDKNLPGLPGECQFTTRLAPVASQTIVEGNLVCGNAGNGISAGIGPNLIRSNDVGAGSPPFSLGHIANAPEKLQLVNDLGLSHLLQGLNGDCRPNGVLPAGDPDPKNYFDLNNSIVSQDSGEESQDAETAAGPACGGNIWSGNYTAEDAFSHLCTTAGSTPKVSITGATAYEAAAAPFAPANFTLTLSHRAAEPIVIRYTTVDGSAKAANPPQTPDYLRSRGQIVIKPGQTSITFGIRVLDDNRNEDDETFYLQMTKPPNATWDGDGRATATIVDNE